jgi:hypothetical protein
MLRCATGQFSSKAGVGKSQIFEGGDMVLFVVV